MTLELFTAIGALVGGSIAFLLDERLLVAAVRRAPRLRGGHDGSRRRRSRSSTRRRRGRRRRPRRVTRARDDVLDRLSGEGYRVRNLGRGVVGATGAGVVSALLGHRRRDHQGAADAPRDGRPAPGRDRDQQPDDRHHRRRPARSSTCSTARSTRTSPGRRRSASSSGATVGSRLGHRVDLRVLRLLFVVVLVYTAVQMLLRGARVTSVTRDPDPPVRDDERDHRPAAHRA